MSSDGAVLLRDALQAVQGGAILARAQAREVFQECLREDTDPVLFGGLLASMAQRGERAEEITGAAEALRAAASPFEHDVEDAVDTCGTGGDGLGSFNLSTAAAVVAAACGARVIKHGNRSVSSKCGSADLLEAAGVPLDLSPDAARRVFEEVGITFLFAPRYHPAMRFAAPVRRSLGIRTVFNFLGPLCNPGGVRRHLLGVSAADRVEDYARILQALGFERAAVVHGAGGADELTLAGENRVVKVGSFPGGAWEASAVGLDEAPVEALAGGDAAHNLGLLHEVFGGASGPLADAVALNAGATLVAAGLEDEARAAVERAHEALRSGAAAALLRDWAELAVAWSGEGGAS